jgi:hypothetical protein
LAPVELIGRVLAPVRAIMPAPASRLLRWMARVEVFPDPERSRRCQTTIGLPRNDATRRRRRIAWRTAPAPAPGGDREARTERSGRRSARRCVGLPESRPRSRTIWQIGFRSTKNARLIRPIVSTVTIPGPLPQRNQGEHSMIRGVGPYSALTHFRCNSAFTLGQ